MTVPNHKPRNIAEEWEAYSKDALPDDAPLEVRYWTKRVFFHGAMASAAIFCAADTHAEVVKLVRDLERTGKQMRAGVME